MKRKLLSVLLTLCLAFSLLPTAALADGEGTQTNDVAQIGETKYATLQEAVNAATTENSTVTLLKDVTELETISITGGKKVDLNLNEKSITFKADNYFLVDNGALNVTGKGNITSSHGNDDKTWLPTIYAYGTSTDTADYSVVTIGKDVVIDNRGSYGLAIGHKDYKAYGAKVIVEGTVKSTYGFTVTGNAKATQGNIPEITVTESGKIVSTDGSAIYAAGYGIYNIAGTLSGINFGIEIRAGKLNVEDTAKISATGNFSDPVPNGNGSTVTGAAIAVSQHTTNLPIDVNIKGGEISETGTNGHALYEIDTVKNEAAENVAKDVSITVSGGSFNGNVYSTNNKLSITGGAFTDIANAVKYAADNATIKLAGNVTQDVTIPNGKTLTLDLNGKTLTNVDDHTILNNGNLTITGTGTVDNISHAKGALYNKGTVVINGGTFDRSKENGKTSNDSSSNSWYTIKNVGSMTIHDGATVQTAGNNAALGKFSSLVSNGYFNANDYNTNKGLDQPILTIDGGTFRGGLNTIKNDDRAKLTINGGTFSNYYQAVVQNHNIAEITGGTFTAASDANAKTYGIYNCGCDAEIDLGTLTVSGGTFTGATYAVADVSSENADVTISGGQFAGTKAAIVKSSTSKATIAVSGGKFSSDPSVYVVGNGNTNIVKRDGSEGAYTYTVLAKSGLTSGVYLTNPSGALASNYYVSSTANGVWTVSYSAPYSGGSSSYDPTYSVSTPSKTEHGTVTVSPKSASKGDTVTVTVKPDSGYVLETLTVTDKNGNELTLKDKGNGKYTFTMPAGKVEVKATFMEDNSMLNFFYDVPNNAYFYEAVKWAVKNGITDGVGNNLFAPEQPCTRAQIVTFLWRAAGSPEPKGAASGMTDVVSGSYYEKAVAWAIENGITTGTTTSTFSPDATCTRAQAVTFLARALKAKAASAAEFSDVPTGSYFADAVAWAAANGVTEGIGGGLFGSDNDCTRGQIVTFLYRAYNK